MAQDVLQAAPASESALARVLATETRLDLLLAEASAQGAEFVREAEAGAAARLAEVEAELERAERELEARLTSEGEAAVQDERRRADDTIRSITAQAARTVELAEWVVRRLIADASDTPR
jgi:hypothetical protein